MVNRFFQTPVFRVSAVAMTVSALMACGSAPKKDNPPMTIIDPSRNVPVGSTTAQPQTVVTPYQTVPNTSAPSTPAYNTTPTYNNTQATNTAPAYNTQAGVPNYHYNNFNEWKNDFIRRHGSTSVSSLVSGATLNNQVITLDGAQAEFSKMPWEYLDSAVSSSRISQGKKQINDYPTLLGRIEQNYATPKEVVVAIWGMESSYGAGVGTTDLVNALSSLAYDGRRRAFAEGELVAMSQLLERGDVQKSQLKGSWAGGMGHTQFIPSTWLRHGVDGNNDGRKNPWNISDALSSTANYLTNSGWVRGVDAYYEVRLPSNFNYDLIGQKLPLDTWRNYGLVPAGEKFYGQYPAELWLPAGINGPALLTTQNFDVIKVYNNSSSYALGVATLAKRLAGKSGLVASWPRNERPLSTAQIRTLQQRLSSQGYNVGTVDGIAGANTRRAFAQWQKANNMIPDGFISQNSASRLL